MTKRTNDRMMELLNSDKGGQFQVVTEDDLSVKYLPTIEDAQELAKLMNEYHRGRKFTAKAR